MELNLQSGIIFYVVALILLVVISIAVFNYRNPTQAERDANRNRLYVGIGVGVLVLTGVFVLYSSNCKTSDAMAGVTAAGEYGMHHNTQRKEYGFKEAFSEWRAKIANKSRAKSESKKKTKEELKDSSLSKSQKREIINDRARDAVREAKNDFRQMKIAGQKAKSEAINAYRQAQATNTAI